MDYRKFYEQETKRPVPDGFDVHHIDENRENNEIRNLVALPRELHSLYHELNPSEIHIKPELLSILDSGHASLSFVIDSLNAFYPIYEKCNHWLDFRDHLLFNIPDVRNLSNSYK